MCVHIYIYIYLALTRAMNTEISEATDVGTEKKLDDLHLSLALRGRGRDHCCYCACPCDVASQRFMAACVMIRIWRKRCLYVHLVGQN